METSSRKSRSPDEIRQVVTIRTSTPKRKAKKSLEEEFSVQSSSLNLHLDVSSRLESDSGDSDDTIDYQPSPSIVQRSPSPQHLEEPASSDSFPDSNIENIEEPILEDRTLPDNAEKYREKYQQEKAKRKQEKAKRKEAERKLRELSESHSNCSVTKNQSRKATKGAQQQARHMYQMLVEKDASLEFDTNERFQTSPKNKRTARKILKAAKHHYGENVESKDELTKALKTYFKSLQDADRRKAKGTYKTHSDACRRLAIMKRKLARRRKALEEINYSSSKREEVQKVMDLSYVSSEEDESEESATRETGTKRRVIRPLAWQSQKLIDVKTELDKYFSLKIATDRQKRCLTEITGFGPTSNRLQPENALEWTVNTK